MRLSVIREEAGELAVLHHAGTIVPLRALPADLVAGEAGVLGALADPVSREALTVAIEESAERLEPPADEEAWGRPFVPGAIAGVGLNYQSHAAEIGAATPPAPGFFTKLARTAVSTGSTIHLPPESANTTAEGELALVVGRPCFRASPEEALGHLAGVCAVLDQTAEDQLQVNVRFLTRSKNYAGFLVLGRDLVTLDEAIADGSLADLAVTTHHNGAPHRSAPISDMAFSPADILSFVSHVFPLEPGDVVATGTPGAVALADGDTVAGEVAGVGQARARVHRPEPASYAELVREQIAREHGAATTAHR
ncbi:fumarylacetoacetate hydrolase family protein [Egibacter rhizosphaerae]|nr:fumarylacetoacetate hydrolase family protein [Egibacter rhizosphaerae]